MEDLQQNNDIKSICQQIADVYKNKMQQAGYDKQGELMNFKWETEYNGYMFTLYFNLPDYWQYAEYGRRPGKFPPPDAILKWIQFKRLVPTSRGGKVPTTKQLVYLISRKIALEGTQGKHLLQQTVNETYNTLVDQLVEAITEQLDKEIEKEIDKIYEQN